MATQTDLFPPAPYVQPTITPEDVRPELTALLEQLQGAAVMPLSARDLRFWLTVAPQMSGWLPAEEQSAYLAAFNAEVERLTRSARAA